MPTCHSPVIRAAHRRRGGCDHSTCGWEDGTVSDSNGVYYGHPADFSHSAELRGAPTLNLTGQGVHDPFLGTAHLGILNSPDTWAATLAFLTAKKVK